RPAHILSPYTTLFRSIYQAGTLSVNPLAMAAGFETLRALEPSTYEAMNKKVDRLVAGYKQASVKFNMPLQVNRAGSMVGFFFTEEPVIDYATAQTADLELFKAYYQGMIKEGLFLPPSQFEELFLSTAHTDADLDQTIQAVEHVFASIK